MGANYSTPENSWAWLQRMVAGATLISMAVVVGMWVGGRDRGTSGRLDDIAYWRREVDLERTDLRKAISALIAQQQHYGDTRKILLERIDGELDSLQTALQHDDTRLDALEADRITAARIEQRLIQIERQQEQNTVTLEQLRERFLPPAARGRN